MTYQKVTLQAPNGSGVVYQAEAAQCVHGALVLHQAGMIATVRADGQRGPGAEPGRLNAQVILWPLPGSTALIEGPYDERPTW